MNITEKVAYLKGLADGLNIDDSTNEGKIFVAMIELLDDMALTITDLEDEIAQLTEQVDEIDEDLADVEESLYDDEDEDDDDDFCEEDFYEIECPSCNEIIYIDEDAIAEEKLICPSCSEEIDIEIDDEKCDCCHCDEE